MEIIAHRINTLRELENLSPRYGVELDLRDSLDGRIYMQHNPFTPGEDFERYLAHYHHGTMILNIKSERIEYQAMELLEKYSVKQYFFLDSTFPMIKALSDAGEQNIALRYSELEGMDTLENMRGKVKWVWVDCFTHFPLDDDTYSKIRRLGYKICFVSPELEGQPEKIQAYQAMMQKENIQLDAVCTDLAYANQWRR